MQFDILADEPDFDLMRAVLHAFEHLVPFGQVGRRQIELQFAADDFRKVAPFQHDGRFVERLYRKVFDDAILFHIAEQRDFALDGLVRRLVDAHDDHVRRNTGGLQFLYGVLRRLGLMIV